MIAAVSLSVMEVVVFVPAVTVAEVLVSATVKSSVPSTRTSSLVLILKRRSRVSSGRSKPLVLVAVSVTAPLAAVLMALRLMPSTA